MNDSPRDEATPSALKGQQDMSCQAQQAAPCKGKSITTRSPQDADGDAFALTGRDLPVSSTQGVALGCGLSAPSGRPFISLFGGSFNPIHIGHIALAREVLQQGLADEVWFNVSPRNPLKAASVLADDNLRLRLVEQAIADERGMRACDIEFSLPKPSYTWHTLEALWEKYPDRQFSLLIGADNWAVFPQWYRHDDILRRCPLIVYPREGYPIDAASLPPSVKLLETGLYPVSSTQIRQRVAQGESIHGLVPASIEPQVLQAYSITSQTN